MKLPTHLALQRCTPCWCNRHKYLPRSRFVHPWKRISCAFQETDRTKPQERKRQACLMGVGIVTDGQTRREMGMSWRWIDRQKESRRRAEIRTKTSVTFCGAFPPPPPLVLDLDPSHTASTVSWCVWPCVCVGLVVGTWQIMTQQKQSQHEGTYIYLSIYWSIYIHIHIDIHIDTHIDILTKYNRFHFTQLRWYNLLPLCEE